jgi:hypothetical protein
LISTAPAHKLGAPQLARTRVVDSAVIAAYLLVAFGLYRDLWQNLDTGYLVDSSEDQNLFEWFFSVQANALLHLNPTLFSTLQNHPVGVNLMGNTAMPGLALPLAPVTWLFGPTATWALALTGGLAGTATGWYLLFSRNLVRSRRAAAIGGALCAFAPPVVSHAVAHPNFTTTFLLPVIVWWLLRLAGLATRPTPEGRRLRDGVVLGLLVGWQVLIGEEPLLILATGVLIFTAAWGLTRPSQMLASARAALPGVGVAVAVALVLVGYPLWMQFFGPASYHSLHHGPAGNDLATFGALPRQSLGGKLMHPGQVVDNPTEQNSFFGWPLLIMLAVAMVSLRADLRARLTSTSLIVVLALSVGSRLYLNGEPTSLIGPWRLVGALPLFNSLIEARMTFAALPLMGMLLAMATDRILAAENPLGGLNLSGAGRLWMLGLVVAALPILPVQYTVGTRTPTPAFFTTDAWRDYVRPGRTLVPVPLPAVGSAEALHWQVRAGLGFAIPEGYFVGPSSPGDRHGMYGVTPRPTSQLLADVAHGKPVPPIGSIERDNASADLRYWQADAVVLPFDAPNQPALLAVLDELLGPGQVRDGVVVWPVRSTG